MMHGVQGTQQVDMPRHQGATFDPIAVLRRNLVIILLATLVGGYFAYLVASQLEPRYLAVATLLLEQNDARLLQAVAAIEQQDLDRSAVETQMDVIRSRSFLGEVVDALDLLDDPRFNTDLRPERQKAGFFAPLVGFVERLFGVAPAVSPDTAESAEDLSRPSTADEDISGSETQSPLSHDDFVRGRAITRLSSSIDVARASNESLAMRLRVSSTDPAEASRLANGIARVYVDRSLRRKRQATLDTIAFLQKRADDLADGIASSEVMIATYGAETELAEHSKVNLLREQMIDLNALLTKARVAKAEADARVERLKLIMAGSAEGLSDILTSQLLGDLRSDRARLQRERDELAENYGDLHPLMQSKVAEIRSIDKLIEGETRRIVIEVENQAELAAAAVAQLQSDLKALENLSRERELAQVELRALERQASSQNLRHQEVLSRLGALERQVEVLTPSAQLVSEAEVPSEPFFPRTKLIVAGGAAGLGGLVILIALIIEAVDTRVRSGFAIEASMGVRHLGYVPRATGLANGSGLRLRLGRIGQRTSLFTFVKSRPESVVEEAIRSVLWQSCLRRSGSTPMVIIITSPLPGDGKTALATAMAAVAAKLGRRTALVDFDLRRSGTSRIIEAEEKSRSLFGLRLRPRKRTLDLGRYLAGDGDFQSLLSSAGTGEGDGGLTAITADVNQRHSNAVFYSPRLVELFAELRANFDITFIDTPPALLVNEATELAEFADFVLLVARWGKTRISELAVALRAFEEVPDQNIGVVVNDVRFDLLRHYEAAAARVDYGKHGSEYYQA